MVIFISRCQKCGAKVSEDSKFCTNCGKKLESEEDKSWSGWKKVVAVALAFLFLFVLGSALFTYQNSREEKITKENLPTIETENYSISKSFDWRYSNVKWNWRIEIKQSRLDYYTKISHSDYTTEDYPRFVTYTDNLIQQIGDTLSEPYSNPEKEINYVLSFVQSLDYRPENEEYFRYPIETLIENGDCEDLSILFTSIAKSMGYDVSFIVYEGHAIGGVHLENKPIMGTQEYIHWFEKGGKNYYTCETTGRGWRVGDVPSEYSDKSAQVIVIKSPPQLNFELNSWNVTTQNSIAEIRLNCSTPVGVNISLIGPDQNEISQNWISETDSENDNTVADLSLSGYAETPASGKYQLIVTDYFTGENIFTEDFNFEGADLTVTNISGDWEYWDFLGTYSLNQLTIQVKNKGDLPAFVSEIEVEIDGENTSIFVLEGGVNPNQTKSISESTFMYGIPSGPHTLKLVLKDSSDQIIGKYSETVTL